MRSLSGRFNGWTRFQWFGLALVIALLGLTALGGTVRATGAGLACPDWPGCYGSVFPTGDFGEFAAHQVYLEWTHRFVAALIGFVVIGYAWLAVRRHRTRRAVWLPAVWSVPLLGVQVVLGGLTVTEDLEALIVTGHLAAAMLIVMLIAWSWLGTFDWRAVTADDAGGGSSLALDPRAQARSFAWIAVGAAVLLYAVVVVGAYVAHYGEDLSGGATYSVAAAACGNSWPLCNGDLWPSGSYAQWHMGHRLIVVAGGLGLLTAAMAAVGLRPRSRGVTMAFHGAVALFLAQIFVGAAMIWVSFDGWSRVLHLMMGAATWTLASSGAVLSAYRAGWLGAPPSVAPLEIMRPVGAEREQVHD